MDPDQYSEYKSGFTKIPNTEYGYSLDRYNTDSYHLTATLLEDVLGPEGVAARDGQVQHRVALH